MYLEFLGTAGYHPSETRHTSCVFLPEVAPGHSFVLDAGSGFFRLVGRSLPDHLHIFLSHPHLDHVMGLTFLLDVLHFHPSQVTIYGDANTIKAIRQTLFGSPLFPLEFDYKVVETRHYHPFAVAGIEIETHPLTHPGGSNAYRFRWPDGKTLCYVTDTIGDGQYHHFISGAPDLLIHERNFPDELADLASSSGHCTTKHLVAAAHASRARQIVATHFNPLTATDPLLEDDVYGQIPGIIGASDCLKIEF
ncbi:ribonuclease BN [Abditibacteriota bacterium]|nr:ribonuclease BN [Abditibacteriota bacterium]